MKGAGSFRHRVKFERATKTPDGRGGYTILWTTVWQGPAHIERLRSFRGDVERVTKGGVDSHPIVRVHVRADSVTREIARSGAGLRCWNLDDMIPMNVNFAQDMAGDRRTITVTCTENQPS